MALSFPPYLLLIPFGIFFLTMLFTVLFNIKHVVTLGAESFVSFTATLFVIAYIFAVLAGTFFLLSSTDWVSPMTVWDAGWFSSMNLGF